jgi:hypothetical protein
MIFLQAPTVDPGLTNSLNQAALATMLGLAVTAGAYVLHRLFSKTDGIITRAGDKHNVLVDKTIETNATNASTTARLVDAVEAGRAVESERNVLMRQLIARSDGSAEALERLGESALDILAAVCEKMDIQDRAKGSIEAFRRDLRRFSTERRSDDDDVANSGSTGGVGRAAGR